MGDSVMNLHDSLARKIIANAMHLDERILRIVGIVSEQVVRNNERLGVAGVIHSMFISETINLLPTAGPPQRQ